MVAEEKRLNPKYIRVLFKAGTDINSQNMMSKFFSKNGSVENISDI